MSGDVPTPRIIVQRSKSMARDLLRRYAIRMDGEVVARLGRGNQAQIPIVPGSGMPS